MSSRLVTLSLVMGAALGPGLAGCGSGDEPSTSPSRPVSSSASPATAGSAAATAGATGSPTLPPMPLSDAQHALRTAGWWRWKTSVRRGDGVVLLTEAGFVDAANPQHPQAISNGGGLSSAPRELTAVYDGYDAWFHAGRVQEGVAGCWVHRDYAPRDVRGSASAYLLPAVPRVFFVADLRQSSPGSIEAAADISSVAESMGSLIEYGLHLPSDADQVPVTFQVSEDGRLTGWTAALDDLIASRESAGERVDAAVRGLHATIEVTIRPAKSMEVQAPAADQMVEWDEAEEPLLTAVDRCGAA